MKQSGKLLNKLMSSYLDDLSNFGNSAEMTEACKSFFDRSKQVLSESTNGFKTLLESASNDVEKEIAQDFKTYVKQIVKK